VNYVLLISTLAVIVLLAGVFSNEQLSGRFNSTKVRAGLVTTPLALSFIGIRLKKIGATAREAAAPNKRRQLFGRKGGRADGSTV
jgi:hypothetical protein